jgi:hypothetical protein
VLDQEVRDPESFKDRSVHQERPVGGYAILLGVFAGLAGGFAAWLSRSGRELPERVAPGDLALVTVATHKASRLVSKDRVTSTVRAPFTRVEGDEDGGELSEAARGTGLRRAIGELLICPYCLGMWIAAAFTAGLIVAPRATRWTAAALSTLFGSDLLQIAYKKAEAAL